MGLKKEGTLLTIEKHLYAKGRLPLTGRLILVSLMHLLQLTTGYIRLPNEIVFRIIENAC